MKKPSCNTPSGRHVKWEPDPSVGCRENPGVVNTGGTELVFVRVCLKCGCKRIQRGSYVTRRYSTTYEEAS